MRYRAWFAAVLAAVAAVAEAGAQEAAPVRTDTVSLSLDEAVRRATQESEEVLLARAQVALARTQVTTARAQAMPQLNASLGYTKTLASPFDTGGGFTLPDSLRFEPDKTAPLEERVDYLERRTPLAGLAGLGQLFSDLPFGQENSYTAYLSGSQLLYSGGRTGAALNIARNYRAAAELGLTEQEAEIELQVRTAYYQAVLAERLVQISTEALAQAERFLQQEQLRFKAGQASELEVLRAEVSRDNLRPQLVQARNAAELAELNLKRLVDLPLQQPIRLSTDLTPPSPERLAEAPVAPELVAAQRAAIRAAEQQVGIREQAVRIARGAFLPSVSFQMNYGRQLFPSSLLAFNEDWRQDWTMGLQVQVPLFTGMRRTAELEQARVELEQARLQTSQLRESVQLQYEQARGERERASAAITARQRTSEVAQRVYDLTVLRYEQGLATQLEVSDARLALLQARTNLAQAIADFYIADAGMTRAQVAPEIAG
jgi:outer membrane protein